MKSEKDVIHTYAEILKLVGVESKEAEILSESYLAKVLRRTSEALAMGDVNKEPNEEIYSIDGLSEFLNENFDQLEVVEELGKQYILFYGEWGQTVLPLLPEEKRIQAEEMIKDLGERLANNLKEDD